jgi:hypothetical protein
MSPNTPQEKLTGRNYFSWQGAVKISLNSIGCVSTIDPAFKGMEATEKIINEKAVGLLMQSMEECIWIAYEDFTSAYMGGFEEKVWGRQCSSESKSGVGLSCIEIYLHYL